MAKVQGLETKGSYKKGGPKGFGKGFGGAPGAESMEKRLTDVEKKLDAVLQELQELRKQFGKKGGPGGGGFQGGQRVGPRDMVARRAATGLRVGGAPGPDSSPSPRDAPLLAHRGRPVPAQGLP